MSRGVAVRVGHREGALHVHRGRIRIGRPCVPENVDGVQPGTVFDHLLGVVVPNGESAPLLLTFFLQFFPDLVRKGHVYILQTPSLQGQE